MKKILFFVILSVLFIFGCGKISFYQELGPYSFNVVPTGSVGANFWAEYGDSLPVESLGIEYESISFDIAITNKLGYSTKLTIVLSLTGEAGKGEVKIYSSTPSYINSDNEGKKFVYIVKDMLVLDNSTTNITSTIYTTYSSEFLSNLSLTTNFWVALNNDIQGVFSVFQPNASQDVSVKVKVRGYKYLGGSPDLDLVF
ncbi:MAG: hypothetical protein ACP5QP_04295 [Brevinematia bacterium]